MAAISQIKLPNGQTYDIKDALTNLDATYTAATYTLELELTTGDTSDDEEF